MSVLDLTNQPLSALRSGSHYVTFAGELCVRLPDLPSAGYRWEALPPAGLTLVDEDVRPLKDDGDPELCGGACVAEFTFAGQGSCVVFRNRRPWMPPSVDDTVLHVHLDPPTT